MTRSTLYGGMHIDWRDLIDGRDNPYRPHSVEEAGYQGRTRGWGPGSSRREKGEETRLALESLSAFLERTAETLGDERFSDAAEAIRALQLKF